MIRDKIFMKMKLFYMHVSLTIKYCDYETKMIKMQKNERETAVLLSLENTISVF